MKFRLLEQAYERGKAIGKIENLADIIEEHLIKCVLYQNTTNDLPYWVEDELSEFLRIIDNITLKGNKQLSEDKYVELLTAPFGDCVDDCLLELEQFQLLHSKQYPEVQITNEQVQTLFNVYTELFKQISKLCAANKKHSKTEFATIIYEILDRNGIGIG